MIFNLAYDWNYFSFSFIRWRFVFQTEILGNFTESIFFVFLSDFDYSFIASLPSGSVCRLYISCILPADRGNPQWSPQRGRWGLGEKVSLFISTMFDGGGGGRLNWEVSLFNNGPIHALQSQVTKIGRKTTSALGSQNTLLTRPGRNKIGQN